MDIHSVRQQLKSKLLSEIPMRVTFYARVSSEKDEQLNSLDNQISYYEDLIKKTPAWEYVEGYIDEGISGTTTRKRENFLQMISDGKNGLFDFVITKEISRFARNTLDSIQYTRELLNAGIGVLFQNDNINTLDEDSELRLSIMSSIAQDESRKLSSRVKFGHAQAIKKKVVLGNSNIYGYVKDHGRLVIDENEAAMVRELFTLYASGAYSLKQLEKVFWAKGYRNRNGNIISHNTMAGIISNPKYKGYYAGNKVKVIDLFTKKQKFLPQDDWVVFKDETGEIVPAIVDEETWERANQLLKQRSDDVKNRQGICNHVNLLSGKIVCTHCNATYYKRNRGNAKGSVNDRWECSGKIKNGADTCPSFAIYEDELTQLLLEVFNELESTPDTSADRYIKAYHKMLKNKGAEKEANALLAKIEFIKKKRNKLLDYSTSGKISDDDFFQMSSECRKELEEAEQELSELQQQIMSEDAIKKRLADIRELLQEAKKDAAKGVISREFINKYIDQILATPQPDGSLKLTIKLFSGKRCDRILQNKRGHKKGRVGNTSKKMIEAYENGLK